MEIKDLFESGMKGKVIYDENEDSYKLQQPNMDFDLCQALWYDYQEEEVLITVKIIKKSLVNLSEGEERQK